MSSDDMPLVSSQNGLNSQLVYRDDPLRFSCGTSQRRLGEPGPKTRELAGFIDDKLFSSSSASSAATNRYFSSAAAHHQGPPAFARNVSRDAGRDTSGDRNWSVHGNRTIGDDSEDEEEEDDYDDDEDEDDEMDDDEEVDGRDGDHRGSTEAGGVAGIDIGSGRTSNSKHNGTNDGMPTDSDNIHSGGNRLDKMGNGNGKAKDFSTYGSSQAVMVIKDAGGSSSLGQNANAGVTVADRDGDMYYSQYLQTAEASGGGGKDMGVDNSFGVFNGRKDGSSLSNESGDSLRAILSDPVTGALMEDAVILPCGHSFGTGGVQHVMRMKSCYSCSRPVSEESISPNLALRATVQAYRREEDLQSYRSPKRRREKFEQERGSYDDPNTVDPLRGKGVQFPFAVTDRVIIKGNKRTPERFVGREAVVTTQCLNGWYVVKTLDNAESVKLQYRSLAKVSDDSSSSKQLSSKMTPNWL